MTTFQRRQPRISTGFMHLARIVLMTLVICPSIVSGVDITLDVQQHEMYTYKDCLECHDIDIKAFSSTAHRFSSCTCCHNDVIDIEKHAEGEFKPMPVKCERCHVSEGEDYQGSIHKEHLGFVCSDCHSDPHSIKPAPPGQKKQEIINKCTECHAKDDYASSGHAAAVMRGNMDSAVCSDCHGLHNTSRLHADMEEFPEEARSFYHEACVSCHGDEEMMARNNMTTDAVDTYYETYHGKVQKLGHATHVAGCADCHTSHNIQPSDNPASTVHAGNLVDNCSGCHPNANENFVKYEAHADFTDRKNHPLLFWTVVAMMMLLIGTFVAFWLHTGLWWRKAYWKKYRQQADGILISEEIRDMENPGQWYKRFSPLVTVLHVALVWIFLGLVITGLPLKFADTIWAHWFIRLLGGASIAGFIHRVLAFFLIVLFGGVFVMSIRFLLDKRNGDTILQRLFSPDSLFLRMKDWDDFRGMMRWFVDMGPMPEFDRWTYWEKFDFLAVFWGMFAIGISGLLLWMPELTAKFLPGWIFNVAIIIHSDEALLAAGFIFTVHFFNTHFIPTKFPLDTVIFTGKLQKYKFIDEKPLHYKRLKESGRLKEMESEAPDIVTTLLSNGFGLFFLAVGLILIVLILVGLIH